MVKKKKGPPRTLPRVHPLQAKANMQSRGRVLQQRKRGTIPPGPPNSFFLSSIVGHDGELITHAFESTTIPGLSQSINSRFSAHHHDPPSSHTPTSQPADTSVFEPGSCSQHITCHPDLTGSHRAISEAQATGASETKHGVF
ncbi:manganese-dependent inorganic pyrophosphatase, partial [Corchorus capsularis]